MATAKILSAGIHAGEYGLLMDRLRNAPLDRAGEDFVRRGLGDGVVRAAPDAPTLLELAMIARQHGLIGRAREIYEHLHQRFPGNRQGWADHLELLDLLGERAALVRIAARARSHVPEECVRQWSSDPGTGSGAVPAEERDILSPFRQLRREEEQVDMFMRIFRGREDAFARQWVDRGEGRQGYVPVRRPLQPGDIRDHLAGRRTYGIYLLDHESRVHVGVIDVDLVGRLRDARQSKKHRAAIRRESLYLHQRIPSLARKAGLCCLPEFSGGKGFHFWFPVREPVPAAVMRAALGQLVTGLDGDVECFNLEIFPKQDRRTGKGFGNLVKLPLGIHRSTGKPSSFVMARDTSRDSQFDLLAGLKPAAPKLVQELAGRGRNARVMVHPRHAKWAEEYPELAVLENRCAMLGQVMAALRSARELSVREEKILLGTLGHLPRAGLLLHHLFSRLPEYNRPLLDYKISRIRGTVLGCRRIHSLLERGGDLPCSFAGDGYPHPLRHIRGFDRDAEPRSEKVGNLRDAITSLKTAIRQVERFM